MAKKSSGKAKTSIAAAETASVSTLVTPTGKPARNRARTKVAASAKRNWADEGQHGAATQSAVQQNGSVLQSSPSNGKAAEATAAPVQGSIRSVPVTFRLVDLGAKRVAVCGTFNGWMPDSKPLELSSAGHWETTLSLAPGRYEYKFMVDGQWIPDPHAGENTWNEFGTLNSVVVVSA
ncbi:MAG: glycogen-binding domain-containing protein [Verrucomicrobiia bacterium]